MTDKVIDTLVKAFATAQAELGPALFDKTNPHFKSKYASLASTVDAAKVYAKHGIAYSQRPRYRAAPDGTERFGIDLTIMHTSGQVWENYSFYPINDSLPPQQMGSAQSYARRYQLGACLGIVSDEDDDGNAAQSAVKTNGTKAIARGAVISEEQANDISALLLANPKISVEKFLQLADAPSISDIMAVKFESAKTWLKQQAAKQAAK